MHLSERIWKAILKSWGSVFAIVSLISSFLLYFLVPDTDTIKVNAFLVTVFAAFAIIVFLLRALYDANLDAEINLPKIRKVLKPPNSYEKASALLLVDPSALLSHDSSVTLFMLEDDYELLVGVGVVINIQNDKKVQVALFKNEDSQQLVDQLKENKKHDLERLVLKPSVPRAFLEGDL
jgi:hypothetical protein